MSNLSFEDKVSWKPIRTKIRTNSPELEVSETVIKTKMSNVVYTNLFINIFLFIGLVFFSILPIDQFDDEKIVGARFMLVIFSGYLLLFGIKTIKAMRGYDLFTFDKVRNVYFRGKEYKQKSTRNREHGNLSDIYAIQPIAVSNTENPSEDYHFYYQLNIVFKDGERLNIFVTGDRAKFEESTHILGEFLNVPVWEMRKCE